MTSSSNWYRYDLACVMALSIAALNACGAEDGTAESDADEPLTTTAQAIIPGSAVKQFAQTYILPANGSLTNRTAPCPTGSIVVGGGHFTGGNVRVHASQSVGWGWSISVINLSTTTTVGIDVYVECLSGTNASSSTVLGSMTTVSAAGTASASVGCPSGQILSGGGFIASNAFHAYRSYPTQVMFTHHWSVSGKNQNNVASTTFQPQAICLSGVTGRVTTHSHTSPSIPPGGQFKLMSSPCPAETLLGSGGFNGNGAINITVKGNLRNFQNPSLWNFVVVNNETSARNVGLNTACLELWPL